jgi:hypothetical protein
MLCYTNLRDGLVYLREDVFRHRFGEVYAMDFGAKGRMKLHYLDKLEVIIFVITIRCVRHD